MSDYKQSQINKLQKEIDERRKNFEKQIEQKRKNLEASNRNNPQEYEKQKKALEDETREFENQINRDWDELNKQLSQYDEQNRNNQNSGNGNSNNNKAPNPPAGQAGPAVGPPTVVSNGQNQNGKNRNASKNKNNNNNNNFTSNNNNANSNINGNVDINNFTGNNNGAIINNNNNNIAATTTIAPVPVPTSTNNIEPTQEIATTVDGVGSTIIVENEKSGSSMPAVSIIILIALAVGCFGFFIIRKRRYDRRNKEEFEYNDHVLQIVEDEPSTDYGKTTTAPVQAPNNDYYQEYANLMANTYNQANYQAPNYEGAPSSPDVVNNIYQCYENPTTVQLQSNANQIPNVEIVNNNNNNNNNTTNY